MIASTITAQLNQSRGNIYQDPLWEEDYESGQFVEFMTRNPCWRSKTMSKDSSGPKHTKTGKYNSGIKFFDWLDGEELVKKLQPPVPHQL